MKLTHEILTPEQQQSLMAALKSRFEQNMKRHPDLEWEKIHLKIEADPGKMGSLFEMERTGGEPDVVGYDTETDRYIFMDCSAESPSGRRSICYDRKAMDSRKEAKPANNAMDMADSMGVEILTGEQYRYLQTFGKFDTKTSSWIQTPAEIRALGGALFADFRYGQVFIYHNGAQSWYGARGFRGCISI